MTPEIPVFGVLDCATIVLRVLLRRQWIDPTTKRVMPEAFFRRAEKDPQGLSVNLNCTKDEAAATFKKTFGIATLHVGRVRNLGLDVIQREPTHANIVGLPTLQEDKARAEWFAGELANQARLSSE